MRGERRRRRRRRSWVRWREWVVLEGQGAVPSGKGRNEERSTADLPGYRDGKGDTPRRNRDGWEPQRQWVLEPEPSASSLGGRHRTKRSREPRAGCEVCVSGPPRRLGEDGVPGVRVRAAFAVGVEGRVQLSTWKNTCSCNKGNERGGEEKAASRPAPSPAPHGVTRVPPATLSPSRPVHAPRGAASSFSSVGFKKRFGGGAGRNRVVNTPHARGFIQTQPRRCAATCARARWAAFLLPKGKPRGLKTLLLPGGGGPRPLSS